jgi:putative transposase
MTSLEQRKALIDSSDKDFSICRQCELLSINRSTLYYTPSKAPEDDLAIMRAMDELYIEDPTRGTRRMAKALQKRGYKLGRYKVRTLMRIMRLKTVYCRPRTTVIDPTKYKYPYLLRNLAITRPNQVWALDITYIPMNRGFMYMVAIMDIYSRFIVGWSLSNTMEAEWVVSTIRQAVARYGKPEIINSDQGSQFTSEAYVGYVKSLETVKISMDGKGRASDNAYIERFFRTIKYDKIYLEMPENGVSLQRCCEGFINFYNLKREHSELSYNPPAERYLAAA